jgi:hypothetical protein
MFGYEEQKIKLLESEILKDDTLSWFIQIGILQKFHLDMFGKPINNMSYYPNIIEYSVREKLKNYGSFK